MIIKNKWIILILLLASVLRFWDLGKVPEGISNDEAGYGMSALSIWKTGRSLDGKFLPLSFTLDNSFAPVQIYLGAPFVGILGLSSFSMRLPFAILSVISIYLLYRIVFLLTNNVFASLAAAFVLSISPWHLQMNRVSYDGPISFSFLWATNIFLKKVKKGSILWSLPIWAIAWYSYHATKPFFIVYILLLLILFFKELYVRRKELLLFSFGIILIIVSFIPVVRTQNVTRQNILLWNDKERAIQFVEFQRNHSIGPEILKSVFTNKILYYVRTFREQYLEGLSPQYLFLYGEVGGLNNLYGTGFRGMMYIIELPLLLFGIWNILRYGKDKFKWFVFVALCTAPLGSAISIDRSYGLRSIMMLPFLCIIVGFGIDYVVQKLINKHSVFSKLFICVFVILYFYFFVSYLYQYYFQYPVYAAEHWFQSTKDLSLYLESRKSEYKNVYVVDAGPMSVLQYGLYNHIDLSLVKNAWNSSWPKKIGTITFLEKCMDTPYLNENNEKLSHTLVILRESCTTLATPSSAIKNKSEPSQTIWKIYE
jgi:4-amino-4-deoxy-L-arabinose transferase-like glycosyltransferase